MNLFKTLERLFVAVVYAESGDSEMASRIVNGQEEKRATERASKKAQKRPQLRV
ncbi:hypothetical protein [Halodesulfovibrio sp.]|uniref:hypothetical protein n=1 Tax=Halodesulfovibrio sp. TaxID=1912772 RepID=UPI0025BFECCF|nr:hypothetical protein [Halodesulfovibrio sp.]